MRIGNVFSIVADLTIVSYELVSDDFIVLRVEIKELQGLGFSSFNG